MLVSDELIAQLPTQTRFEAALEVAASCPAGVHALLRRID